MSECGKECGKEADVGGHLCMEESGVMTLRGYALHDQLVQSNILPSVYARCHVCHDDIYDSNTVRLSTVGRAMSGTALDYGLCHPFHPPIM